MKPESCSGCGEYYEYCCCEECNCGAIHICDCPKKEEK